MTAVPLAPAHHPGPPNAPTSRPTSQHVNTQDKEQKALRAQSPARGKPPQPVSPCTPFPAPGSLRSQRESPARKKRRAPRPHPQQPGDTDRTNHPPTRECPHRGHYPCHRHPESHRTANRHPPDTGTTAHPGRQPPAVPGQTPPGLRPGGWLHSVPVPLTSLPQQAGSEVRNPSTPWSQPKTISQIQDQNQNPKVKVETRRWPRRQQKARVKPGDGIDDSKTRGLDQVG
jgi:hypothetical protein